MKDVKTASEEAVKIIGAITEALRQTIPEHPTQYKETTYCSFVCPECRNSLRPNQRYCDNCGQKLDWSNIK